MRAIHCGAKDDSQRCMRLSTERKLQRCMVACGRAKRVRRRDRATLLHYETRIFTCNAWMISTRHLRFSRVACSATELTRFTSAVSQPVTHLSLMAVLRLCNAREQLNFGVRGHVRALKAATCRRTPKQTSHHNSTVYAQHLAGDVTCFLRREECYCAGDFFR